MEPAPFRQLAGDTDAPARAFWVRSDDGIRLRLALWQPPQAGRGTILLFPGRSEYAEKYAGVARDLNAAGYAALIIDWRGQGLSQRLQDDPFPGHIGDFADYQRDVVEMVVAGTQLGLPRPWHLLAHSMGGAIGLAALHSGLPVQRVTFSSPMWGINLGILPRWLVQSATRLSAHLGREGRIAPQRGGNSSYVLDDSFNANLLTHDVCSWTRLVREAASWPDLTIGGASFGWVGAALRECRRLAQLPPPDLPALIAAGTQEQIVSLPAITQMSDRWPQARLIRFEDARHELLMESPPIRQQFMGEILEHFAA